MPVERRLRNGLQRNADVVDPDIDRFLAMVVHRTKRRVLVHRVVASVAVAAAIVGAIVFGPWALDAIRSSTREVPADHRSATPSLPGYLTPQRAVIVGLDGTIQREVPGLPGYAYAFNLSRDGTKIAFVTDQGSATTQIGTIGIDGSGLRILSGVPFPADQPAWSPDGSLIAFEGSSEGNTDIYVVTADGSDLRRLTSDPGVDEYPSWSADGTRIVYDNSGAQRVDLDGYSNTQEIYTVVSSGGSPTRLTHNGYSDRTPAYSPDGAEIAWQAAWDVWIMDADGRNIQRFPLPDDCCNGFTPQWSPNGTRIAYTTYDPRWRAIVALNGSVTDRPVVTVHLLDLATGEVSRVDHAQMATISNTPRWLSSGDALLLNRLERP